MTIKNTVLCAVATAFTLTNAALSASPQEAAAHKAHDSYLAAINSNDLDAFLEAVTDDIVFIAPNAPVMVGKSVVGSWVHSYFEAVETFWEKTSVEFVVADEWAFERYTYRAIDTPREGGDPYVDTGNGINIYRMDTEGVWRVARDVWATDQSLSEDAEFIELASCISTSGPC